MAMQRSTRRSRVATAVAACALAGGALVAVTAVPASAEPVSLTLNYTCRFPLIGQQPLRVEISANAPDTIVVGEPTPAITFEAVSTVNASTHMGLRLVGAATVEGSAVANATLVAPEIELPIELPIEIARQNVPPGPPYAAFPIRVSGQAPEITFAEAGPGRIDVGNIALTLTPRRSDGSLTGLRTFTAACTVNAGQDTTLAEFEITAARS